MTPAEALTAIREITNGALKAGLFHRIEDTQMAAEALAVLSTLIADKSANDEPGNN